MNNIELVPGPSPPWPSGWSDTLADSTTPAHAIAAPRRHLKGMLIVGRGDLAHALSHMIELRRPLARPPGVLLLDDPLSDDPERLRSMVAGWGARRIVVAEPDVQKRQRIVSALLESRARGVDVEDAVELYERLEGKIWLAALDPEWLAFARGFRITPAYLAVKRVLDVALGAALLLPAVPIMALIALAIRLESRGPVLYRQERIGHLGQPFTLYKFRSMRADAERDGPAWARENDDRVTRIGGFLRKSHLDELPQVLNVLRGDLSFVGPRPERPCFVDVLRRRIPLYELRHFVKPGITGWAQVRFPYAGSIEDSYEKLQYDLHYARAASLHLDLEILARTALVVLTGKGR